MNANAIAKAKVTNRAIERVRQGQSEEVFGRYVRIVSR